MSDHTEHCAHKHTRIGAIAHSKITVPFHVVDALAVLESLPLPTTLAYSLLKNVIATIILSVSFDFYFVVTQEFCLKSTGLDLQKEG